MSSSASTVKASGVWMPATRREAPAVRLFKGVGRWRDHVDVGERVLGGVLSAEDHPQPRVATHDAFELVGHWVEADVEQFEQQVELIGRPDEPDRERRRGRLRQLTSAPLALYSATRRGSDGGWW